MQSEGLNLLINNAGLFERTGLEDVTREEMRRCFEINATGPLMMAKVFVLVCLL